MPKLTDKQEIFVAEYLKDLNATQAAIRAGYSEKTADTQAAQLLRKTHIVTAIQAAKQGRAEQVGFDAADVLRAHVDIHNLDVADILDDDGAVLPVKQWPKVWRKNISSIDVQELTAEGVSIGQLKKLKWPSKLDNLKALGQHVNVGAYSEQIKATLDAKIDVSSRTDAELESRLVELLRKAGTTGAA